MVLEETITARYVTDEIKPEGQEVIGEALGRDTKGNITIPFAFTMGIINVAGTVKIPSKIEDLEVKGVAIPGGDFTLNRQNSTFEASAAIVKMRIGVDFNRKQIYWQGATRSVSGFPPKFKWKWHGRNEIYSW